MTVVGWWEMATRYPVASVSSALFYASLLLLLVPSGRVFATKFFTHPIKPHQEQVDAFDSLRGVAALAVAFAHIWWFSRPFFDTTISAAPFLNQVGNKAVPVFCALSGYLIYRSVLSAQNTPSGLRAYVIRRFFRIYPVYLLSVCLALLSGLYDTPEVGFWTYLTAEIAMLRTLGFGQIANPATWSLYIEVTFYAFLPFLVLFVDRHRMLAVSIALFFITTIGGDGTNRHLSLWKYFALGIIASEISVRIIGPYRAWIGGLLVVIGAGMMIYDMAGPQYDWFTNLGLLAAPVAGHTIGLGIGVCLLIAGLPHSKVFARLFALAPLQALGMVSYSLFLLHPFYIIAVFPEVGAAKFGSVYETYKALGIYAPAWFLPAAVLPGAIFWAAVVFLLVERPGMRWGARIARERTAVSDRPAGGVVSAPTA